MAEKDVSSLVTPLYIGSGGNRSRFDTDGSLVFEGNATVYDDVIGQLTGSNLFETPGKADYSFTEGCLLLSPSGVLATDGDAVMINFQIPHSAKIGSPFLLHLHWFMPDNTARTFQYQYRVRSTGQAKPAWSSVVTVSTGTAGVNAAPFVAGGIDQISNLGSISLVGAAISARVQVRIARTDAVAGDLQVDYIDGHVERDSFGSRQEFIK